MRPRIIPALLLSGTGFVKTTRFRKPKYLGDPMNIVRIFNDKEVDEIVVLDILATPEGRSPRLDFLAELASECFMPLGYGGGIRDVGTMRRILELGVEKVVVNTAAVGRPGLIAEAADTFGSQSVVASIDAKRLMLGGYEARTRGGQRRTGRTPVELAKDVVEQGAGEVLITSVDRDGTMAGYDLALVGAVAEAVDVPVIACGGAGSVEDLGSAIAAGASAAAAGSLFVFQGNHRAVLVNYPSERDLDKFLRAGAAGVEAPNQGKHA